MDPQLIPTISAQMPEFNPKTSVGLACSEMKKMEEFIHQAMLSAALSFPPGLTYDGYQRCTPNAEYAVATAKTYSKHVYEMSKCDTYMVAYYFSLNGVPFKAPRYMYLPYVHRGGIIHIRGVKNHISPVLADIGVSVESDNIFIWLSKTKLIIERTAHTFITSQVSENGERLADRTLTASVTFSNVHHINDAIRGRMLPAANRNKAVATLIHYVLCKYGVSETFRRFCDTEVVIGGVDINQEAYPSDKWVICRSTGYKPRDARTGAYMASDVRLAIPADKVNNRVYNIVAAMFYVIDHFPERLRAEYLDETTAWCIQLGHVIFKSDEGEGKLQDYISGHLRSIEDYMDHASLRKLATASIQARDIYELFMEISDTAHERMLNAEPSSVHGKRLSVLDYVAYDLIIAINHMAYRLGSSKKAVLTENDIRTIMNNTMRTDTILKLSTGNGFTEVVSSPGDNLMFKITNQLVMQTSATGSRTKSRDNSVNPANFLHASVAEVGSFGNLPKSDPIRKNRISPYIRLNEDGAVVRMEEHRELLDQIQDEIRRK